MKLLDLGFIRHFSRVEFVTFFLSRGFKIIPADETETKLSNGVEAVIYKQNKGVCIFVYVTSKRKKKKGLISQLDEYEHLGGMDEPTPMGISNVNIYKNGPEGLVFTMLSKTAGFAFMNSDSFVFENYIRNYTNNASSSQLKPDTNSNSPQITVVELESCRLMSNNEFIQFFEQKGFSVEENRDQKVLLRGIKQTACLEILDKLKTFFYSTVIHEVRAELITQLDGYKFLGEFTDIVYEGNQTTKVYLKGNEGLVIMNNPEVTIFSFIHTSSSGFVEIARKVSN